MNLLKYASSLRDSLNKTGDYGYVNAVPKGEHIPKLIHQCFDSSNLHPDIQQNIEHLKKLNPGWEYRFYDDADMDVYIQKHFPALYPVFLKIDPAYIAARVDFFRYLLIYNEGGVYLDIKSSVSKPLDEILRDDDQYILSHWPNEPGQVYVNTGIHHSLPNPHGEFQQWHIMAVKGHPFLKAVIENVCHNIKLYNPFIHHTGRWGVIRVTGPIAYTLAINPILDQHPHRLVRNHYDVQLVYSIFSHSQVPMHHSVFKKKHYSAVKLPVIRQLMVLQLLFLVFQPVKDGLIHLLKKLK